MRIASQASLVTLAFQIRAFHVARRAALGRLVHGCGFNHMHVH